MGEEHDGAVEACAQAGEGHALPAVAVGGFDALRCCAPVDCNLAGLLVQRKPHASRRATKGTVWTVQEAQAAALRARNLAHQLGPGVCVDPGILLGLNELDARLDLRRRHGPVALHRARWLPQAAHVLPGARRGLGAAVAVCARAATQVLMLPAAVIAACLRGRLAHAVPPFTGAVALLAAHGGACDAASRAVRTDPHLVQPHV
mmetsp:Transcript_11770/g.30188  ORF Transcript_11770/g.30188 Transcript_11770/m.30188 type:complete len:204 (-) Transcript_11770:446-1057(-)